MTDHPHIDPEGALRLAVNAINDAAGLDGMIPFLLVFGPLPSFPAVNMEIPAQRERKTSLQTAQQ